MIKVLFVCSGNTCRSPMAQAIFNEMATKEGLDATAFSAGLYTEDGLPYSKNSVMALEEEGIKLSGSSKQINEKMLEDSDYVFGLTCSLGTAIISAFPEYSDKVYRFPVEVPDPFGSDIVIYKRCLINITEGIKMIIDTVKARKE